MAKITVYQKEYLKAYEELLKTGVNVSGLVMLTEMSYNTKEKLVEYKSNPKYKANDYSKRMNACFTHMLSTFFKIDSASKIYDAYKRNFAVAYLDNKEDDTNDYKDETMIKLNKIYNFINNLKGQELKGTELLSMIRKEITNGEIDEPLEDDYFNISFDYAKDICEQISLAGLDVKMVLISELLYEISDMETHLYRYKLFEEDYRKSITGLVNYLFSRAGIPEIYIKPIELDYYYSYLARENSVDTEDLIVFYKEKMCDSIEDVLIAPMKNTIFHHTDIGFKQESGALDNPIVSLRQNKYK